MNQHYKEINIEKRDSLIKSWSRGIPTSPKPDKGVGVREEGKIAAPRTTFYHALYGKSNASGSKFGSSRPPSFVIYYFLVTTIWSLNQLIIVALCARTLAILCGRSIVGCKRVTLLASAKPRQLIIFQSSVLDNTRQSTPSGYIIAGCIHLNKLYHKLRTAAAMKGTTMYGLSVMRKEGCFCLGHIIADRL